MMFIWKTNLSLVLWSNHDSRHSLGGTVNEIYTINTGLLEIFGNKTSIEIYQLSWS